MKKINILIIMLLFAIYGNAQVAIEKTTFVSKGSILEFNDDVANGGFAKGIILPMVDNLNEESKQGTLLLDVSEGKIKYKNESEWVTMTDASSIIFSSSNSNIEDVGEGVVISDTKTDFTDTPAVLKLDSNNKALLLPRIQDVTKDISNPEPGTIAYDKKSQSLAVFNGEYWFFWNAKTE